MTHHEQGGCQVEGRIQAGVLDPGRCGGSWQVGWILAGGLDPGRWAGSWQVGWILTGGLDPGRWGGSWQVGWILAGVGDPDRAHPQPPSPPTPALPCPLGLRPPPSPTPYTQPWHARPLHPGGLPRPSSCRGIAAGGPERGGGGPPGPPTGAATACTGQQANTFQDVVLRGSERGVPVLAKDDLVGGLF